MSVNLDRHAKEMRAQVYSHMLEKRGWKYKSFLRYLRLFKYAAFAPTRGEFLESYYTLMRYMDDIVDGDVSLPKGFTDESSYVTAKINFSKNPESPKDEADYLMSYCFQLAEKMGEDFKSETEDILESLLFDAKRRGKMQIFSKEELNHHFHLLDIRGTIRATLKVFKEDPDQFKLLEPLGIACRYQYDLEDFESDIAAGYINISKEECEKFDIGKEDILNISSPAITNWFRNKAEEGLRLLDVHHENLKKGRFSLLSRATFYLVYELPARDLFRKVLSQKKEMT